MKIEKIYAIAFIILFALLVMPLAFADVDEGINCEGYGLCDAVQDGIINSEDSDYILSYAVSIYDHCGEVGNDSYCDVNGDGEVTAYDAALVFGYVENTGSITYCVTEGGIASPSLGPVHGSVCCEGLSSHALIYIPEDSDEQAMVTGAPVFCYDAEKGEPNCKYITTSVEIEEGWYYPDGELILGYDCYNQGNNIQLSSNDQPAVISSSGSVMVDSNSNSQQNSVDIATIGSSQGVVVGTEEVLAKKELKQMQYTNGVEIRFLNLEEALLKYIKREKRIIAYIEENYPNEDPAVLYEVLEKTTNLLDRAKSIDITQDQDFASLYVEIKTQAIELVKIFRDEARSILPEEDALTLREEVENIESDEANVVREIVKAKIQKYNSEQVRNVLSYVGVEDEGLVTAVETGTASYDAVRSRLAQSFQDLTVDEKKEIALKMKEARTKLEVQKEAIAQKLRKANLTAAKQKIRTEINSIAAVRTRHSVAEVN